MRVLYISKYASGPHQGVPTRQFFYCKSLADDFGAEVLLISSRSNGLKDCSCNREFAKVSSFGKLTHWILDGPEVGLGFSLIRLWSWFWFEVQVLRSSFALCRWRPDVVVVSSLSLLTILTGVLFKYLLRIPFVLEVRDVYPLTLVEVGRFGRFHPAVFFLSCVERIGYELADEIVSSLQNFESHVQERIGRKRDVAYLPMGYDPSFFESKRVSHDSAKLIQEIAQSDYDLKVGYCGAIGSANALREPLEAFARLAGNDTKKIGLWIVGAGPLRKLYEGEYSSFSNIHFAGPVPKDELQPILAQFDLVLNSWRKLGIYRFGISPNKWIDYMYAGKPILLSYSGFPFLIDEYEIGWRVEAEDVESMVDALLMISNLPNCELTRRGANGKQYLEANLSYRQLGGALYKILKRLTCDFEA